MSHPRVSVPQTTACEPDTGLQKAEDLILPMLAHPDPEQRATFDKVNALMTDAAKHSGGLLQQRFGWPILRWRMVQAARRGRRLKDIENQLRPIFQRMTKKTYRAAALKRAANAFDKVKDHLAGQTLLDLGAGNGLIGQIIQERTPIKVTLADVIDYSMTSLPIILFPQGGRIPMDDASVDTVLIYVVLHHATDPEHLLGEAVRVARRRLVIMEGYVDDEDARIANCFVDWFINRVVQGADINLPFNFRTTVEWRREFAERGLSLVTEDVVGIDEPIAPESHVLFVLDKQPS